MKLQLLLGFLLAPLVLGGCEVIECHNCKHSDFQPTTITVNGHGAPDIALSDNRPQQALMAIRASEVEAFRSLAEQIKGVEISSGTKVDDFITRYDHINAQVHAFIVKNARINSQTLNPAGYYETNLSLTLNEHFYRMFTYVHRPTNHRFRTHHHRAIKTRSTTTVHYNTGGVYYEK